MPDERKWRYRHSDIHVITYLGQCFGPVQRFPRQRCRIEVFYIKLLRRDSPHESQDVGCRCASVESGKEVCHHLRSAVWIKISMAAWICSWPQTIYMLLVSKMCRISSLQPRLLWLNFIYLILSYSHFILLIIYFIGILYHFLVIFPATIFHFLAQMYFFQRDFYGHSVRAKIYCTRFSYEEAWQGKLTSVECWGNCNSKIIFTSLEKPGKYSYVYPWLLCY